MRKKETTNAEEQHHNVASAQVRADQTSAQSEHGSVHVGKGTESRTVEVKLVNSVVNLTTIDASNRDCGKVETSRLPHIRHAKKGKANTMKVSVLPMLGVVGTAVGLTMIWQMWKGKKISIVKK